MWSENQLKYSEKEFNPNQIYLFPFVNTNSANFPKTISILSSVLKKTFQLILQVEGVKPEKGKYLLALVNVFSFLLKMLRIIWNY